MSQLTDRLERDLREIAADARPSPSAWDSIVARLGEEGGSEVALVVAPLRERPKRPVRLAAAAAAVAVVLGSAAVLATRDGGDSISSVEPEPATEPSVAPTPDAPLPTATDLEPPSPPFVGTWVSTDTDGSSQTMEIVRSSAANHELVLRDDVTVACFGAPATITGTGRLETGERLVFARPELTCDDGTLPRIGPPPQDAVADLAFELDTATGELVDAFGVVWRRDGAPPAEAAPVRTTVPAVPASDAEAPAVTEPAPALAPGTTGGMWPQSSLVEVRRAQELANAGDPSATWQLDARLAAMEEPWDAEILTRFVAEKLGWEGFTGAAFAGYAGAGGEVAALFIRCAPGGTNRVAALHADAPLEVLRCAPTIDDVTYETVSITATQPGTRGASGIWVVDRWEIAAPRTGTRSLWDLLHPDWFDSRQVDQAVPPSDTEVHALLEAFLGARVAGAGADSHLLREPAGSFFEDEEVPLLYAASSGAPYERFEFERLQGPVWPNGWTEYDVRLVAADGTLVEQSFHVVRHDGQLGLVYGYPADEVPTTENGRSVPVPYRLLGGEVTFGAAPPWRVHWSELDNVMTLARGRNENVVIASGPPVTAPDCGSDVLPAQAEALARRVMEDPDFELVGTAPVRVAGIDGVQVDVAVATTGAVCFWSQWVTETQGGDTGYEGWRMRLYLIDQPGETERVLTIAVIAPQDEFERVLVEAVPIVGSLQIRTG